MEEKIISSEKDVKKKTQTKKTNTSLNKTKENKTTKIKEDTELKELKEKMLKLEEESRKKDEQLERFMQIMAASNNNSTNRQITADDVTYIVTTNAVTGVDLVSPNGETIINIPNGELIDVTERDLREVFRKKENKNLFENNICSFVCDEEDNDEFKKEPLSLFRIKIKRDLSDEHILEVLKNSDANSLFKIFDEITNEKENRVITHTLFHKICQLDVDGKLIGLSRIAYDNIEKYFHVSISQGVINLGIYKSVPRP